MGQTNESEMHALLSSMGSDLVNQTDRVSLDIKNINTKIDSVLLTMKELK